MMRTQEEIVERVRLRKPQDFFGFEITDLISYLDFEHGKQFLKEDSKMTAEEWEKSRETRPPKEVMSEYMPFAWEKANNYRGLSSARSISHYQAWLWLDGNEELANSIEDYQYYGKPQLVEICNYLGLDPNQWDDGVRRNSEPD